MSRTTSRSIVSMLVLIAVMVSCGDDSTVPPPEESNVTVESSNAVSESIGPEGGSLTTSADDGTVYTLDIPQGSIERQRTLTMTPIASIKGYPLAAGLAGGVDLEPSGLVFAIPATLTIQTAKTPGSGTTPIGITFDGDATSFSPTFAGTDAGSFTIAIDHFSGGTAGFATADELSRLIATGVERCVLASATALAANDLPAVYAIYRSCFASDVLPALQQASDDRALAIALGKYDFWKDFSRKAVGIGLFAGFDDSNEVAQFTNALIPQLQDAIARNNDRCRQQHDLEAAANIYFWYFHAQLFGVDSAANHLDGATIDNLCLRPVIETTELPANMQVGFPHSLDIDFGVIFDGETQVSDAPFFVQLAGDGIDIQHPSGFTDATGKYTTVVTATRDNDIHITANACLSAFLLQKCVTSTISSTGQDLTGTWCGSATYQEPGSPDVLPFHWDVTQNQNAVTGPTPQGGMSATLSGTSLLNVTLDRFDNHVAFFRGQGSVNGNTMTIHIETQDGCCKFDIEMTRSLPGCP